MDGSDPLADGKDSRVYCVAPRYAIRKHQSANAALQMNTAGLCITMCGKRGKDPVGPHEHKKAQCCAK